MPVSKSGIDYYLAEYRTEYHNPDTKIKILQIFRKD